MDTSKYFICELCTKKYKHRQSLYKHNCLSVSQKSPSGHPEVSKSHPNVDCNESSLFESTLFKCDYCPKEFKYKQGKSRHQIKCKQNITNNRNDYAHVYDPDNKVFKLIDKDELVDELIDYRVCDIEEYYMQYKNELDLPVKNKIEELIEHRGDNESTKGKIKLLLFNNRHKIEV